MSIDHAGPMTASASESIDMIAPALVRAVNAIQAVKKDNQGHGYNYADLASCLEESRRVLEPNGLIVLQPLAIKLIGPVGSPMQVVRTILLHESGQWIASEVEVPEGAGAPKMSAAQAIGSAVTYMRRYSLCAMLSIPTEDDDGHAVGDRSRQSNYAGGRRDSPPPPARRQEPIQARPTPRPASNQAEDIGDEPMGQMADDRRRTSPKPAGNYMDAVASYIGHADKAWKANTEKAGVEFEPVVNAFQVENHLASWAVEAGVLKHEHIETDGKRDRHKLTDWLGKLHAKNPDRFASLVASYVAGKIDEKRKALDALLSGPAAEDQTQEAPDDFAGAVADAFDAKPAKAPRGV